MSKFSIKLQVGDFSEYLDIDRLKTLMNENRLDVEQAVTIYEDGEFETKRELYALKFEVEATYYGGSRGSLHQPPEEEEMEISSISSVELAGKKLNITKAFNDEFWDEIDRLLMREVHKAKWHSVND